MNPETDNYKNYLSAMSLHELRSTAEAINCAEYPERYQCVIDRINELEKLATLEETLCVIEDMSANKICIVKRIDLTTNKFILINGITAIKINYNFYIERKLISRSPSIGWVMFFGIYCRWKTKIGKFVLKRPPSILDFFKEKRDVYLDNAKVGVIHYPYNRIKLECYKEEYILYLAILAYEMWSFSGAGDLA